MAELEKLYCTDSRVESVKKINAIIENGGGGGLEIGDIGIAPLGIDETKGKRRYLNGQLIIQEQYAQFTNKVKSAVALYPSLACTESEWQTTATMTVGGQVGKFVVDDEAGTIRLPKITMPIQGLTDLSKLGEIVEAGLPNITGSFTSRGFAYGDGAEVSGSLSANVYGSYGVNASACNGSTGNYQLQLNASRSSSIYGNSNTVQQEQIQYPYFIQVATGAETEDNIINEIELNNPFSFGDSKYSPVALNNLSWLKSEGQWNSKAVYPSFYDWALTNFNNGIEGFALSTDEYTDYDVVINPADETFRLALLNGSEDLPSDRYESLTLLANNSVYTAPANGWYNFSLNGTSSDNYLGLINQETQERNSQISDKTGYITVNMQVLKGQTVRIQHRNVSILASEDRIPRFIYAQGNGSLYYYVGETVQNANLINAGRIEEKLVDKVDTNASNLNAEGKSLIATYSMPSDKYIDLTVGASGTTYTAPANGWFVINGSATGAGAWITLTGVSNTPINTMTVGVGAGQGMQCFIPCRKSDGVALAWWSANMNNFRFVYAEGDK